MEPKSVGNHRRKPVLFGDDCAACIRKAMGPLCKKAGGDDEVCREVDREMEQLFAKGDPEMPAPWFAAGVHRILREKTGVLDPFIQEKRDSNKMALAFRDSLRKRINESSDPFETAVKIALAGNIIDFALIPKFTFEETVERMLGTALPKARIKALRQAVFDAKRILYIGDNAGETVADALLIERLETKAEIVYAVRGGPCLNDATREDAEAAKIHHLARIVDTGVALPGVLLSESSEEFVAEFRAADLVISKGMGNFETLLARNPEKDIFYLLIAKCEHVAEIIGCPLGVPAVLRENAEMSIEDQVP